MSLTNPNFYLTTVLTVLLFFVSLTAMGVAIYNDNNLDLNEQSKEYILELNGISIDAGFQEIADTDSGDSASSNILESEQNSTFLDSIDYLASLYLVKEKMSKPMTYLHIIFNVPSSIINSLGIPISKVKGIINILSYTLLVGLLITIWVKFIK